MIRSISATALCLLSLSANAQFTISGTVRGGENKERLQGAVAILKGINKTENTDKEGEFQIGGLAQGTYFLSVKFLGYTPYETEVEVNANVQLEVLLQETSFLTDEVIVTALRAKGNTPTTYSDVSNEAIAKQNYGQDLPMFSTGRLPW